MQGGVARQAVIGSGVSAVCQRKLCHLLLAGDNRERKDRVVMGMCRPPMVSGGAYRRFPVGPGGEEQFRLRRLTLD